ncbi:MAG: hypothetical protein U0270_27380 [Labilithrix sp.]
MSAFRRRALPLALVMAVRASLAHADDTPPPPTAEVPTTVEPPATPPAAVTEAPAVPTARAPTPPPYSVPWQLRPIVAPTVLRFDTSAAFYEDARGRGGATIASLLTASYRIPGTGPASAGLAPLVRVAFVTDDPAPGNQKRGGATFVNPLVGAAYAIKLDGGFRLNAFLGATIPVGGGGGDAPFAGSVNSRVKGLNARAQLDNALFATNDFTLVPGFGVAYVKHGVTLQVEATLLHLMRVRGEAVQPEASKTNITTGLHVGYFVLPELSVGTELRYQRWLNAPFAVEKDKTDATRDTWSMAVGPRAHVNLGALRFRPGISYQRGLDKPLAAATPNYHIVQVDLPLFF